MKENEMSKINKGILRLGALVLILALVLTVAIPALADSATPNIPAGPLHTVQGKVTDISNISTTGIFTIQSGNQQINIATNTSTKYYMINMSRPQNYVNTTINGDNQQARRFGRPLPSRANDLRNAHIPANWRDNFGWLDTFDTQAGPSNIQIDDRVIARVDSNKLAYSILIIQAPVNKTVKGTVNSVSPGTSPVVDILSITPNGSTTPLPLNVTANTRIMLKGLAIILPGQTVTAVYNSTNSDALTVSIQAAQ